MSSPQHGLVALADLRELDHRHPDRVARDVAEPEAAVEEALRDGAVDVVRGRAGAHRRLRRLEVLLVGLEHPLRVVARLAAGRSRARPRPSGRPARRPRATAARSRSRRPASRAGDPELGRAPPRSSPSSTMSIVSRPQPCATKYSSHGARISRSVLPGSKCSRKIQKPSVLMRTLSRTDSSSSVALDRARVVERDVPGDELDGAVERRVVAHRHHVVEAVDADALPAAHAARPRATRPAGRRTPARRSTSCRARRRSAPRSGRRSPGRRRAAAARTRSGGRSRSRDRYVTAPSKPVYSLPHDDHGVEPVARHRLADRAVPPLDLVLRQDLCPSARLLRATMPPPLSRAPRSPRSAASARRARGRSGRYRRSGSRSPSCRRASTSCSIDALWSYATSRLRRVVDQLLGVGVELDALRRGDRLALVDEAA